MKNKVTYVLMVAKVFPQDHPRAGEPTNFKELIADGVKIHTIRNNYKLWAKRIDKIRRGEAILSLRQWEGKPYKGKQVEIFRFEGEDVGYEALEIARTSDMSLKISLKERTSPSPINWLNELFANDGLNDDDFFNWFAKDIPNGIIIHFTKFRYQS